VNIILVGKQLGRWSVGRQEMGEVILKLILEKHVLRMLTEFKWSNI
jgi:hypothetical protein